MSTKPPSRTADQFVVRLPEGMRDRISSEADLNGRSMNAEIVTRLQASFEAPKSSFLPEIRISLDTGNDPISWDEIHEILSAIRKKMDINDVSLHVTVETPELVSSAKRAREAMELAQKLRVTYAGNHDVEARQEKKTVKRIPRKPPAKGKSD